MAIFFPPALPRRDLHPQRYNFFISFTTFIYLFISKLNLPCTLDAPAYGFHHITPFHLYTMNAGAYGLPATPAFMVSIPSPLAKTICKFTSLS